MEFTESSQFPVFFFFILFFFKKMVASSNRLHIFSIALYVGILQQVQNSIKLG